MGYWVTIDDEGNEVYVAATTREQMDMDLNPDEYWREKSKLRREREQREAIGTSSPWEPWGLQSPWRVYPTLEEEKWRRWMNKDGWLEMYGYPE